MQQIWMDDGCPTLQSTAHTLLPHALNKKRVTSLLAQKERNNIEVYTSKYILEIIPEGTNQLVYVQSSVFEM